MAYSSIGHMGYALIGLAVGTPEGVRGVLVYMIVYVFMTRRHLRLHHRDAAPRPRGRADLRSLRPRRAPIRRLALAMAVFMFSLAGIPPMSGLLRASCTSSWPPCRPACGRWPIIGVLTSVVGAFYYICASSR